MKTPQEELFELWRDNPQHHTTIAELIMLAAGYLLPPRNPVLIGIMEEWSNKREAKA